MKVIIPVKDESVVAAGFNATADVCIFDLNKQMDEACCFIPWRKIIPAGSKITKQLKDQDIYAVLTVEMQLMALNLFRENGIAVYKSDGIDLKHNLSLLSEGNLSYYSVEDALENKKICGGECSECTTDDNCEK